MLCCHQDSSAFAIFSVPSSETTMSEEKSEMLKTKLEFFSGLITWKIRLVLILVKHLLAAASVASVFPFNFSQAPWKEKCYHRSSRAISVDAIDYFFLISYLPESVTKLAAASEHQTQRVLSSFPWAHDDDLVHDVEVVEETLEQPLDVQTWFRSLIQSSIRIVGSRF